MPADIYCHSITESGELLIDMDYISCSQMFWTNGIGDENGNQMIVMQRDEEVYIYNGRLTGTGQANVSFTPMTEPVILQPGEKHKGELYDLEGNKACFFQVRNLGNMAIDPMLN